MPDPKVRSRTRAIVALFVVTLIWGGTFTWMKQANDALDRRLGTGEVAFGLAAFLAVRFGIAALCMLVVPRARAGLSRASWRAGAILGLPLLVGFGLQMTGLREVTPAVSAFLTSLYVVFTAAITAWIARRRPGPGLLLGALLATAGAALIRGRPQLGFTAGEALTLASALAFGIHILLTDRLTRRFDPLALSVTSFAVVAIGAGAVALAFAGGVEPDRLAALAHDREMVVALACMTVLGTIVALTLMNVYQRELDPVRAAILYALEPIWASIIGIAAGYDHASGWLFVGGALLLGGNLVAELWQRRDPSS